ncbi:MAG: single-stranded-DNA-specific exonuclease RecJ [Alphaproteobacteria bacterium RIFCSPHIGHO2_02_FULL_46_13]|nr:MAG: single-stranded-DNA-specific exonuclease RecJ [Alphaproteobacteria bacterium RIFCSPHIGHO2_02_FULL_46_13]
MSAVLKVDRSAQGARWIFPEIDNEKIQRMMSDFSVPEMVARLLVARNVETDQVDRFLYPRMARDFPDPSKMADMPAFAAWMAGEIAAGKKIAAFCDFDVDGSTSAALLKKFFRHLGMDIPLYIPDRMTEGYGPNAKAMHTLRNQGADIVLMADCGTTAFDVLAEARSIGLDVCVFDHHEQGEKLPDAKWVINPKRKDDTSGFGMLAAVGVTFLACVAMNKALREAGYFKDKNIPEVPLKEWLDLVGLGTVCDMVPLTGPNRLLVRAGFQQMAQKKNLGLKALCEVGGLKKDPTPEDAGFVLGPRINAGSRVHQADLGAKLLSSEDAEDAKNMAWTLNDCNSKRRDIQADMMREANDMIEKRGLADKPLIMVADESWHVGLNGLVAGEIKQRYGKPACCIAFAPGMSGELEGRGSGRSVPGFNMAALFMAAKDAGLVIKGGGHAMAAGFTVMPDKIPALEEFFQTEAEKIAGGADLISEELVDGIASIRGVRPDFVKLLQDNVGPFGQENPEPRFVIPSVRVVMADIVGESHVRLQITDAEGGARMKAVAFRAVGTPLGDMLLSSKGGRLLHLLGQFKINHWNGVDSVEFLVDDVSDGAA